ncbi:uncharacterized protein N7483_006989 [Penicillium malachiteum]|uniref:uncharacterized protein n=1 Tax=Penicillium malachiteum TaxID=1324776 RepID=UPI002547491B|nr:uncharacterized protein N7483_006989 [Penicillium malachiteum]KAJ5725632.1 hypothetical protein N7483_006989 [Penicillium malachiteum]
MDLRPKNQFDPRGPDAGRDDDPDPAIGRIYKVPVLIFRPLEPRGVMGRGLPMPKFKSSTEVRQEASSRVEKIFINYKTLHEIVTRHEDPIRKRWSKKTRAQRLKILLSAWPNMPSMHCPDFDAFQRKATFDRDEANKYRDCFMWPYINQENLLTTKASPLLLNARGRHPPSYFAAADMKAMFFGAVTRVLPSIGLARHTMILSGIEKNTRDYGRLMAWEEHPEAAYGVFDLKQFDPGEGLLILEAQGVIDGTCSMLSRSTSGYPRPQINE